MLNYLPHWNRLLVYDVKYGKKLWTDAIGKEITNVGIAFEVLENSASTPVGWLKQTRHLIFDVKMLLAQKLDRYWMGIEHQLQMDPPVSHESIRIIAFTYTTLNDIDVIVADIQTAYLQASSSQKHNIICRTRQLKRLQESLAGIYVIPLIQVLSCGS